MHYVSTDIHHQCCSVQSDPQCISIHNSVTGSVNFQLMKVFTRCVLYKGVEKMYKEGNVMCTNINVPSLLRGYHQEARRSTPR